MLLVQAIKPGVEVTFSLGTDKVRAILREHERVDKLPKDSFELLEVLIGKHTREIHANRREDVHMPFQSLVRLSRKENIGKGQSCGQDFGESLVDRRSLLDLAPHDRTHVEWIDSKLHEAYVIVYHLVFVVLKLTHAV